MDRTIEEVRQDRMLPPFEIFNRMLEDEDFLVPIILLCLNRGHGRRVRRIINMIERRFGLDMTSNEKQRLARRIIFQLQKLEIGNIVERTEYGWRMK